MPTVVGVLLLVLGVLALDATVVTGRVDRLAVELPRGPGETWVLVGEDSRARLPEGASVADFGSVDEVPGSRADVVLVVHRSGESTTAFSVPRDLVVPQAAARLALTWLEGPQSTVDALCALGIAADHLLAIDLAGFAAVVDAAGGLTVDVPAPVRDPAAGLELREAGRRHVDGATALALVRSRSPQELVDGRWVSADVDPDGRASHATAVAEALARAVTVSATRPVRLHGLAWALSGALTVDSGTSARDLLTLADARLDGATVLPVGDPVSGTLVRFPTAATRDAVAAAGMSCAP
ncbi:LCP family protein [Blastococcus litoris]|uniref:LCP family protein n=1 Tax=Blastococcus litoris TaxID=2171622 RepID=UPI001F13037A|nr:LCP family protein [Blastococcus litoris]